jgi:hypothetical protein
MNKDVLKYLQPNAVIPIDMETTTMLVNALKERLADPMREVQRLGQEIEQAPVTQEALKLALEFVKSINLGSRSASVEQQRQVITAIKEALAQTQEPVAWQVEVYINGGWSPMGNPQLNKSRAEALASNPSLPKEKQRIVELYAHPPQRTEQEPTAKYSDIVSDGGLDPRNKFDVSPQRTWVGLTVDELITLEQKHIRHEDLCRAIDAKLKEKNT